MITIENLTKSFGKKVAVEGLTLSVREGEVLGLLGPNGAGKTTTVRMLACLIAPTSGRATIGGWVVGRDNDQIRANVGILTESPGLYDKLSAQQNLDFFARLYGLEDDLRGKQVEKYLRILGLWERRHEPVVGFSKGMKQKIAIARALVHEPKLLFLDEPTSALDPESAHTVRDFIETLRSEGRTIFLCTHNLDEADRLCDRIAILRQRLIRVDTPSRMRSDLYGRRVEVQLKEVTAPVLTAVRALGFAGQLEVEEGKLVLSLQNPEEQNPTLVKAIVGAGGEIQFVGEVRHSLEEVYLTLVQGEEQR
ncbi:MAG: ABC transporter ATP-binding protein [Chloroflexi bacterium]|nr:ABC transporter ATP-binding protein [Chloroflexota bacterium]